MKIERTKNAGRNMVFGIILKIYQIVLPFIMRTALIYFMGVQYLGLSSLFASVLQVLNLAELGVGSAMVYSMYKPIVEDDKKTICALMRLYRTYYRWIGIVIGVVGLALLPMIPNLVKGDIPSELNIYILYLLNLGTTVFSYWLFAYKNSLLNAFQRVDVISNVTMITSTILYILQFCVLCFVKDYYAYLIVALVVQILKNILTAIVVTRMYPDYKPVGKLSKSEIKIINGRIRDLFTAKVCTVIVGSADTIVVSAFLGLTVLAIYQNYYYIITSIIGFITVIYDACFAGIGNSLVAESKEKNFNDFNKMTFIIMWIVGFCCTSLLCLYQPFMKVWVGEDLMFSMNVVVCLCIYFFVREIDHLLSIYKDAAGLWHNDRFRPLVTALANLGMNVLMVQYIGIFGIILSTVLSYIIIGLPWLIRNIFTNMFEPKLLKPYLRKMMLYSIVILISCALTYYVCELINLSDWGTLILRLFICTIMPNLIFCVAYHNQKFLRESAELLERMLKGKIPVRKILHIK